MRPKFQWAPLTAAFTVWLKCHVCIFICEWKKYSALTACTKKMSTSLAAVSHTTGMGPTWLTILFSQVFPCFPDIALSVWVFSNLRMLFSQKVHCFPPADFVYSLIFPKQNWTVVPWLTLKSISLSIVFRRNKGGQIFFNPFCVSKNTESYCSCFVLLQVLKEINFKTNIFWC